MYFYERLMKKEALYGRAILKGTLGGAVRGMIPAGVIGAGYGLVTGEKGKRKEKMQKYLRTGAKIGLVGGALLGGGATAVALKNRIKLFKMYGS